MVSGAYAEEWEEAARRLAPLAGEVAVRGRLGTIAALLGERKEAMALLRVAFEQGRHDWLALHTDPDLDALRAYRPFREWVRPRG